VRRYENKTDEVYIQVQPISGKKIKLGELRLEILITFLSNWYFGGAYNRPAVQRPIL